MGITRSLRNRALFALVSLPAVLAQAETPAQNRFKTLGVGSCTRGPCHNQRNPSPQLRIRGNEYAIWVDRDKHAKAYTALKATRSQTIAANLGIGPAHRAELCLSCHSIPTAGALLQTKSFHVFEEGVGCESCHGPAEKWLVPHTKTPWRSISASEKHRRYGMYPVSDLRPRISLCVGCHVGAPGQPGSDVSGRDVYHDLIAAGHPRLRFDFGSFRANLPAHWKPKRRRPDYEVRSWALGLVKSTQASLNLLQARASAPKRPWPEFAEYNCYSCHKTLGAEPSGETEAWASWFVPGAKQLMRISPGPKSIVPLLAQLQQQMDQPFPDRGRVAQLADELVPLMDQWGDQLDRTSYDSATLKRVFIQVGSDQSLAVRGWDGASQQFLILDSLHHALRQSGAVKNRAVYDKLTQLYELLNRFPDGVESPSHYDSAKFLKLMDEVRLSFQGSL